MIISIPISILYLHTEIRSTSGEYRCTLCQGNPRFPLGTAWSGRSYTYQSCSYGLEGTCTILESDYFDTFYEH